MRFLTRHRGDCCRGVAKLLFKVRSLGGEEKEEERDREHLDQSAGRLCLVTRAGPEGGTKWTTNDAVDGGPCAGGGCRSSVGPSHWTGHAVLVDTAAVQEGWHPEPQRECRNRKL